MARLVFDLYARGEERVAHAFRVVAGAQDDARLKSEHLGKAWGGLKKVGLNAAVGVTAVGGAMLGAGTAIVAMTDSVVGLNLQAAKAKTVLGTSFAAVDKAVSATGAKFGLTRIEALGLAGTFADMAKNSGFTTKAAADMSVKFVDLAGRVKLLSGGQMDSAAASEALSAAFRGEYDSLQRVVPSISAAKIEQVALKEAHVKSITEFNKLSSSAQEQAKMMAILTIVQGGTKTSTQLMATEEGKKAIAIERSRTAIRQQWQDLQQKLLPVISTFWAALAENLNPQLQDLNRWLSSPEGRKGMDSFAGGIAHASGTVIGLVGSIDDMMSIIKQLGIEYEVVATKFGIQGAKISKSIAEIPIIGDEKKAKDAQRRIDNLQGRLDQLNTEASQIQIGRLQNKIDRLRGKTVDATIDPREKERAVREIQDLQRKIDRLRGNRVTITAQAIYYGDGSTRRIKSDGTLGPIMRAAGGPIGRGRGYVDEVDVKAMRGEHMLTTDDVAAMGGHEGVYQFRAALHGGRQPQRMAAGGEVTGAGPVVRAVDSSVDRLTHRIADQLAKNLDMLGGGMIRGWVRQWAVIHRAFPGAQLHSGFRFGAVTSSGNQSYHALGRAIDVTPSMAIFNWIAGRYGRNTKELIYSPAGSRQLKNGRPHYYSGQVRADHWDHVHWAMDRGGVARGLGMFAKMTRQPERVLSGRQTVAFERLVSTLGRNGGATVVEMHVHAPNYLGPVDELARGLAQLVDDGRMTSIVRRAS